LLTYPKEKEDFHFLTQVAAKEQICIGNEIEEPDMNCIDMNCTEITSLPKYSFLKDEGEDKEKEKETSMKEELAQFLQSQFNSEPKIEEAHEDMLINNLL
jgi:hypothetical protein